MIKSPSAQDSSEENGTEPLCFETSLSFEDVSDQQETYFWDTDLVRRNKEAASVFFLILIE